VCALYLDIEAIDRGRKATRCDSVHPGYGFLSENTSFAKRCLEEGIAFIGRRPETLTLFGDKTKARDVSGPLDSTFRSFRADPKALASVEDALAVSKTIGYPVMLKAAGGSGGGRGMRVVRKRRTKTVSGAFARCQSELLAASADDSVLFQKLVAASTHIEVQILPTATAASFISTERDCSVQLRNHEGCRDPTRRSGAGGRLSATPAGRREFASRAQRTL